MSERRVWQCTPALPHALLCWPPLTLPSHCPSHLLRRPRRNLTWNGLHDSCETLPPYLSLVWLERRRLTHGLEGAAHLRDRTAAAEAHLLSGAFSLPPPLSDRSAAEALRVPPVREGTGTVEVEGGEREGQWRLSGGEGRLISKWLHQPFRLLSLLPPSSPSAAR